VTHGAAPVAGGYGRGADGAPGGPAAGGTYRPGPGGGEADGEGTRGQ
jgi:hypothetical protein